MTSRKTIDRLNKYNDLIHKTYQSTNTTSLTKTLSYQITATVELYPASLYRFQVSAVNELGEGDRSTVNQSCITPATRPHKNPSNVCTDLKNCSQLVITWEVASFIQNLIQK